MNANKLKNTAKTKTSLRSEKGMTLIDVAIATMVIGLLATPILYTLNEFKRNETLDTTEANIAAVNDAIERYFIERNSFPCPADPTLPLTDDDHGAGAESGGAAPNACDNGVIIEANGTYQGAIPHKDLGLSPDQTYDGWGNKLLYVVTSAMALNPNAETETGAIHIDQTNTVIHPIAIPCAEVCADTIGAWPAPGTAPACNPGFTTAYDAGPTSGTTTTTYNILSHGSDGIGAYTQYGTIPAGLECDANADSENCNGDEVFISSRPTFGSSCDQNETQTAARFDDYTWSGAINQATELSSGFPSRMFEDSDTSSDGVGGTASYTGINNTYPEHELDVVGNILITDLDGDDTDDKDAVARSDEYCTVDGDDCFSSDLIGGESPRMRCGGGTGMTGIRNSRARCVRQFSQEASGSPCGEGQFVVSLTEDGFVCGP